VQLFFVNPRYEDHRWDGARVHITQLTKSLTALGHRVFAFPHLAREELIPLQHAGFGKLQQLRQMDAFYVRIEGTPPVLPRFMKWPMSGLFRHVPVVWEVNATPQLRHLKWSHAETGRAEARLARFRQASRQADLAICNTHGLADYARDLGITQRAVVPLGSDPDLFFLDASGTEDVPANLGGLNVVWCGNAAIAWHDLDSLMAAARELESEPGIRFYIVAKEPPIIDLPANVVLLGERPYAQMPGLLAHMDVGLCLYRKENWTSYGTFSSPLKLFDYMASGLIILASPIEQVRECFSRGDIGFMLPFEEPVALADTLKRILREKPQMQAKRTTARLLVTQYYNWRRVAEETAQAILSLKSMQS